MTAARRRFARSALAAGLVVLAAAWLGPLPYLTAGSFAAHMALHMAVVAMAAPLLALGLVRGEGAGEGMPAWAPLAASFLELAVIWAWHTPALHTLARADAMGLAAEQASFLGVSLVVWIAALAAAQPGGRRSAGAFAGAGALAFTAMHMTMLGVAIALSPRLLCRTPTEGPTLLGVDALRDQEAGAILMLAVGGAVHLAGALALAGRAIRSEEASS